MADQKSAPSDEREKAIPVFTVLKNNAILKNIFLLDNPPPSLSEPQISENGDQPVQEFEETLVVGRHPDCNITLEHPSISRFHLRIHSKPSSRELSVFDLSSVHGTWVSGKKIEAGVTVELKEGDTIKLGASSRVYRLHWVPLSRAYDMDNPFVPPLDNSMQVEEPEEDETPQLQPLGDDSVDLHLVFSDENSKSNMGQLQSPGNDSEDLHLVFSDENSKACLNDVIPSAPPLPDYLSFQSVDEALENISISNNNDFKRTCGHGPQKLESESDTSSWSFGVLGDIHNQCDHQNPWPPVRREALSDLRNSEISFGELGQGLNSPDSFMSPFSHQQKENTSSFKEDSNQISVPCFSHQPLAGKSFNSSLTQFTSCVGLQVGEQNQDVEPLLGTERLCGTGDLETLTSRVEKTYVIFEQTNSSVACEEICPTVEEVVQQTIEDASPLIEHHEKKEIPSSRANIILEIEDKHFNKVHKSPRTPFATAGSQEVNLEGQLTKSKQRSNIWSRRGKPSSVLQIRTGVSKGKSEGNGVNADVELPYQGDPENSTILTGLDGDAETFTPDKENCIPSAFKEDTGSSPVKRVLFQCFDGEEESFTPDKENRTPNSSILPSRSNMVKTEDIQLCRSSFLNQRASSEAFCTPSEGEEEVFTPDKENFSPNTLLRRSVKKMTMMQNMKRCDLSSSLRDARNLSSNLQEQILAPSVKRKQVVKVHKGQDLTSSCRNPCNSGPEATSIKRRAERVPFQPLVNSGCKVKSLASTLSVTTKNSNPLICGQTAEKNSSAAGAKRRWNMVVDCSCLLNAESRKALQLLQGLKGTQLIIPRIVIRELDCLNRRGSIFRRKTEASSALDWIDECMVETKWWIHVQSSEEEGRPYAPTPPASPQSFFSAAASPMAFSAWGSILDIVSPMAEDHILEYALHSRRTKSHEQLVLLSNDVSLKIKSMAEGLICETSEEFRESLVNPFSERFLWKDSSPRGPTWTCADDVVLKENFYSFPSRKPTRSGQGGAKGLKLILLNNARSRYAKTLEV